MRTPNASVLPGASTETTRAAPNVPEPLLPRHNPPAPAAAPATLVSPPVREPDEVHIHIGRIEVTAIREPEPRPREARKGPAPLSLDDYLAKRKGDGR